MVAGKAASAEPKPKQSEPKEKAKGNGATSPLKLSTINLRVLAAASLFASKDEARYYLQGVCVELDERGATYVGTDGYRLIAYRDALGPDEEDNLLVGAFIIPTPHCKHYSLDKEEDGRAKIFGNEGGRLTIAHNFVDVTFLPIDGVYPHWRRLIPPGPASGVLAQFNLKLLGDLDKLSKQLELGSPFIAPNGDAPALIWFSGHPHVMGIMMPIRAFDETGRHAPQWARRGGPEQEQSDIEDALFTHDPETGEIIEPPGGGPQEPPWEEDPPRPPAAA